MIITFNKSVSLEKAMHFEKLYEEELQSDEEEKCILLKKGFATWLFVDGQLAGEIIGIKPEDLPHEIKDVDPDKQINTVYCYSATIFLEFQGKGLSRTLHAYWIGTLPDSIKIIIGHATAPAMMSTVRFFGANFLNKHENWYGTGRTAWFYTIRL